MDELHNCLTLADGTILEKASCGYSSKNLWCWIPNKSMAECFKLFSDPENIRTIECYYYTERITYKGFTEMLLIRRNENSLGAEQIEVQLTWPEGGEHSIEEIEANE